MNSSGAKQPFVGAVYESVRPRSYYGDKKRWQWKIIERHPVGEEGDLWELARIGGNRTRRGNLLRTTEELTDPKKWKLIEEASSPPLPSLFDGSAVSEGAEVLSFPGASTEEER